MSDRITIIQPGPLSIIGRGIRARLEQVFPPAQFAHVWIPGRIDSRGWARLTRRTPAIALGFGGFNPAAQSQSIGHSDWFVFLLTKNEAGDEQRLFGDRLAPGLFGLVEVAVASLHGHGIEDGGTVMLRSATHTFVEDLADDGLALATLELLVPTDIGLADVLAGGDAEPGTANTQDILWDFATAGTVAGSYTGSP